MDERQRFDVYRHQLQDLGFPLSPRHRMLDLGSGGGQLVAAGREQGYDVWGCDFEQPDYMKRLQVRAAGYVRLIPDPYAIPFEDGAFDVVVSDQVFEHVMDYPGTLAELHRVMKPGGVFIHMFPSRYRPIEPHVFVPFGTMVRAPSWLRLWASLGIRNSFQKGQPAAEVAAFNRNYLMTRTHYLSRRDLRRQFERYFTDVQFVEKTFLKYARRGRPLYALSGVLPFLPALYSSLHGRVVFGRRRAAATSADRAQETLRPVEHQQRFRNAAH